LAKILSIETKQRAGVTHPEASKGIALYDRA